MGGGVHRAAGSRKGIVGARDVHADATHEAGVVDTQQRKFGPRRSNRCCDDLVIASRVCVDDLGVATLERQAAAVVVDLEIAATARGDHNREALAPHGGGAYRAN